MEIIDLELKTRGQTSNHIWKQERSIRLTASHFDEICRMMKTISSKNKITAMLYSSFSGNKYTKYGLCNEVFAKQQFEEESIILLYNVVVFLFMRKIVLLRQALMELLEKTVY